MNAKYYVVMTDKFMSGWGEAKDRINKLILGCDSYDEALIVFNNAHKRSEMSRIRITDKCPYYSSRTHLISYHDKTTGYESWYEKH